MSSTGSPENVPNQSEPLAESPAEFSAEQINVLGWRQGSVLPGPLVDQLKTKTTLPADVRNDADLLIVITHDCDLIHGSLENEPFVEVLLAKSSPPESQDGQLTFGKNPRRLQFSQKRGTEDKIFEAEINDRFRAPRECLASVPPDGERALDQRTAAMICAWISKRYFRAAFPDTFESRIRPKKTWIRDQLRKNGKYISAIFLMVPDKELAIGQPYQILMRGTMRVADFEDNNKRETAQTALDKIAAKLADCVDVEVKEWELVSEQDISLDDLHFLKRWDYDSLSYQGNPPGSQAPSP